MFLGRVESSGFFEDTWGNGSLLLVPGGLQAVHVPRSVGSLAFDCPLASLSPAGALQVSIFAPIASH